MHETEREKAMRDATARAADHLARWGLIRALGEAFAPFADASPLAAAMVQDAERAGRLEYARGIEALALLLALASAGGP